MWRLLQYRSAYDWVYAECDEAQRHSVDQRLRRLAEKGSASRAPISKPLEDGIFECRAKNVRLLFFFEGQKRIIVVLGFIKKVQKTPPKHIREAIKRRDTLLANPGLMNELAHIH